MAYAHKNPALRVCAFCEVLTFENDEHLWWVCPCWAPQRRHLFAMTTEAERSSWPACTRKCGIWIGQFRRHKFKAQAQTVQRARDREDRGCPPPLDTTHLPEGSERWEDGFLLAGGDGACPNHAISHEFGGLVFASPADPTIQLIVKRPSKTSHEGPRQLKFSRLCAGLNGRGHARST